jgi:hypothetical protein
MAQPFANLHEVRAFLRHLSGPDLEADTAAARAMEIVSAQGVQEAYANTAAAFRQPDGSYRIGASFRCLTARP